MYTRLTAVISKLTFGTLFLFAAVTARAQATDPVAREKGDTALVKYLGAQEDMVLFNVAYKNPGGAPFTVIIKDQDWTQLYQGTFKDKDFYKQFRLPRTDKNKITFIIRNFKDADMAKTFEINVNSRFVEDVAVKKLN